MRLGIVTLPSARADGGDPLSLDRIVAIARRVEELGFAGLWVTDSLGRGSATLDPLLTLAALCPVTRTIELGTCVLQVPIRPPVELAHRIRSLDVLSGGRLRLGVGTGSTRADFDLVGADYEGRFKALPGALEVMRRAWQGERVNGGTLTPWPGAERQPQVLLGAWRNHRWIERAAATCEGWIASGIHSKWSDLEAGIGVYRAAGGRRAAVANIYTDLRDGPRVPPPFDHAQISLACAPAEARERLKRLAGLGFDDALLICPPDAVDQLEAVRGLG